MTRRIFRSILLAAAAVLLASLVMILGVLYQYFTGLSQQQLQTQASLIAQGVNREGADYFTALDPGDTRVTWIAADGTVLYDSQADPAGMENHADREEFIQALQTGTGHSARYSATLTERMLYQAKRLTDGSVVRVAGTQNSILTLVLGLLQPTLLILVLAVVLSALLASRLAKRIVRPLNRLDLDTPLDNDAYEELSPLLERIEQQHRQLNAQMDQLRRRQEQWDTVTGSMQEGIVVLNGQGVILSINKSARALLGADERCVGADFLTVCRRLELQTLLEAPDRGETAQAALELNGRDYQVSASPILEQDSPAGAALLFFDVTDKAQAEQLRREFTANVSHELKTPLHTISGSAEIMLGGLVEPEDKPRFLQRIYDESQRMITLVDDIIRLSRLDEGAVDAPRAPLSLLELARDAAQRLEPAAQAHSVTLAVSGDAGDMTGVASLISELIYNLCDNAIRYNQPGGSVTVTVADAPSQTALTVADTGIGIPAEAQDRVFERFYRVDKSHSKQIGGTGLGLSIVKHVALLHQARISLESQPGQGTAITVAFPKED